jgi:hypothetical protein
MTPVEQAGKCAQCKVNDLDTTGNPKWCKSCRARYQREYQVLKLGMGERKGFHRGVAAMRALVIAKCQGIGSGRATGYQFADWIAGEPLPEFNNGDASADNEDQPESGSHVERVAAAT